ncbi:MAG: LptA/OstA family protein [Pseudomonadota bacterium]
MKLICAALLALTRSSALMVALMAAGLMFAPAAMAEEAKSPFKGLSKNSGEPIDIFSDLLTIYDEKKLAVFKGNVEAKQGASVLTAVQLDVHYIGGANQLAGSPEQEPQPAAQSQTNAQATNETANQSGPGQDGEARGQIEKILAKGQVVVAGEDDQTMSCDWLRYDVADDKVTIRGNVVIKSEKDQTTTGDWAIYDVADQKAVVGGNVVLSQGRNVLKGDRL